MDPEILGKALHEARLKIERARHHVGEAQLFWERYTESDFCKAFVKHEVETGEYVLCIRADALPEGLALAIGDAVHCLSVSFDYLATGLMRAVGKPASRVTFPMHDSRKSLRQSFMPALPSATTPANRRIVEALPFFGYILLAKVKPYKEGGLQVWEIRKADNIDKHNLIVPVIALASLSDLVALTDDGGGITGMGSLIVRPGRVTETFSWRAPLKIKKKGNPSASISFAEGSEVFPGNPVFPTLLQCVEHAVEVWEIIRAASLAYMTKNHPAVLEKYL